MQIFLSGLFMPVDFRDFIFKGNCFELKLFQGKKYFFERVS